MTSSTRYVRPLSPFERMWLAAQSTCGLTLVEGCGSLTLDTLRGAIERAALANPGSRVRLKGYGPWAHWEETDVLPTVTEITDSAWEALGADNAPFSETVHIDPHQAPSASYVLIHGAQTRLVQRTHHATMDGMAALMMLKEIFRALRNEPLVGAHSTATDLELCRTLGGRSQKLESTCLTPYAGKSNGMSGTTWQRLRVKGAIQKQPLPRIIMAIAACARRSGAGEVLIDIPVNLRNQFPGIQNMGNLTGSVRINVKPHATIDSINEDIRAQLAANKQANAVVSAAGMRYLPIALMRHVARTMERRAVASNRFTPTATVTNLGKLDMAEFSCAGFQAGSCFIVPPGYDGVPLFLGLFGVADGIDLCARAPNALASDGRLTALLEELGAMLSAPSSV